MLRSVATGSVHVRAATHHKQKVAALSTSAYRCSEYLSISNSGGVPGCPNVNARYRPSEHPAPPPLAPYKPAPGASQEHWGGQWTDEQFKDAVEKHVMLTWGPSGPAKDLPRISRSEGVYMYDEDGKQLLDWTSQAVCTNFGHTVPENITNAIVKQLQEVPYVYSGMGVVEPRARLSKLLAEIVPGDITGFLFPCGGAEANEAAIRIARRYSGKQKILTQYRSYHGGTSNTLAATGDFRRGFGESGISGFVKVFNPQPNGFTLGATDEEVTKRAIQMLEEQILQEGAHTIAAVMMESVVGANGVLLPPEGYMQGVRSLCNKYGILLILDEVMSGFGRTGKLWGFQHFENVLPDIVTSAKGLTGAFMPMALVGVREPIRQFFLENPLGWGSTYQAQPVAVACAYESVKFTLDNKLTENAAAMQIVMFEEMQKLVEKHACVKQGRALGLFGCLDLVDKEGRAIHRFDLPLPGHLLEFKKALRANGLICFFRPPLMHCCPPLVINESELRDGFQRLSKALTVLDQSL